MRYDTLLLDADGTLLDFERSEREAVTETMTAFAIDPTEERIATYSAINDGLWKALERGEIEKSVLLYRRFALFLERFGMEGGEALAKKMAAHYMQALSQKGYLLDGARALCEALCGRARLFIVTNGVKFIQEGRYAISGLGAYMDDIFISEVVGFEKPRREYFDHVARHIPNFCPGRTLMVGDSLTSDIKGGMDFGLDTCWYNPKGKAPAEALSGRITYTVRTHKEIVSIVTGEDIR